MRDREQRTVRRREEKEEVKKVRLKDEEKVK